jgi:hypothetical protein
VNISADPTGFTRKFLIGQSVAGAPPLEPAAAR